MKTLKIVPINSDGTPWCKERTNFNDCEKVFSSGWYLHGKLAELVDYDIAIPQNAKSIGYYYRTKVNYINGPKMKDIFAVDRFFIPVEVEGISEKCVGFFWIEDMHFDMINGKLYPQWNQRGLVCLESEMAKVAALASDCKNGNKVY